MTFNRFLVPLSVSWILFFATNPSGAQLASAPNACNTFTFDATGSEVPQEADASFLWDFGDGTTSREPIVNHTYLFSGTYTVSLSIVDEQGSICEPSVATRTVQVHVPPRAFFFGPDSACIDDPVNFDATASYADDGSYLDYTWDFGDGETRRGSPLVRKAYRQGGSYEVNLTIDDRSGMKCSTDNAKRTIHINEPPKADAGPDNILRCSDNKADTVVHFDASYSSDPDNDPLTYTWDFGDGHRDNGQKVTHRYARNGHYEVQLIVTDNKIARCGVDVDFVTVRINEPPQAQAGNDVDVCVGEKVDFDGSGSYIAKPGTASALWSFGDGTTSRGLYASHRYEHPGIYQAKLTLTNELNSMCPVSEDTRVVRVNSPPKISIIAPSIDCVDKTIEFKIDAAADPDGDQLVYFWNFGDGTTFRGGPSTSHQYRQGGDYQVRVVADDQKQTACSSATAQTRIRINTPPMADAGLNQTCCVGQETLFSADASADADGDPLIYRWDFGDGYKAEGESVMHTYEQAGNYSVFLTVDDQSGTSCSTSSDGFVAKVKATAVPRIGIR